MHKIIVNMFLKSILALALQPIDGLMPRGWELVANFVNGTTKDNTDITLSHLKD